MEFLSTLWLPILLSAVFVFIVSSIIHMVIGYHAGDYKKLPNEDAVMSSLRDQGIAPGDYVMPKPSSMADMRTEEFQTRAKNGPVAYLMVREHNAGMGKNLFMWFLYSVIVSVFSAYIGVNAVGADGDYLDVFRFVGCAAFMGYSLALLQDGIWMGKNWGAVGRNVFDGLIYALVTAGTFGWLWG